MTIIAGRDSSAIINPNNYCTLIYVLMPHATMHPRRLSCCRGIRPYPTDSFHNIGILQLASEACSGLLIIPGQHLVFEIIMTQRLISGTIFSNIIIITIRSPVVCYRIMSRIVSLSPQLYFSAISCIRSLLVASRPANNRKQKRRRR